jgi:hypothetical protein
VVQHQPDRPTSAAAAAGTASNLPVAGGDAIVARPPLEAVPEEALKRAIRLSQSVDHPLLSRVLATPTGPEFQALNNALMDTFRVHGSLEAFSLLFEMNTRPFSVIANRILRMTGSRADIGDILQETFLAIYRYPSRFCPDKPNAFRNWS